MPIFAGEGFDSCFAIDHRSNDFAVVAILSENE
jgi:hypothetical protein